MRWNRLLSLSLVLALASTPALGSTINARMGTLAPEGSGWMNTWYKVIERIEKDSPVPFRMQTYPGGVMGDEPDLVRKLRLGQLHFVGVTVSGIAQLIPEILVLGLPFMFRSYDEVDHVVAELMPTFQEIAASKNLMLITMLDQGMIEAYSANPVNNLQELTRQRVWTWSGNPINLLFDEALGIRGVPAAVPELMTSLQTGLINTVFTSPTALVQFQWHTRMRYRVPVSFRYEPAAIIASTRVLNMAPAEHRDGLIQVIQAAVDEAIPPFLQELRRDEDEMRRLMVEAGVQKIEWPAAEVAKVREQSRAVWNQAVERGLFSQEILDRVIAILDEYRATKGAP